MIFAKRDYQQSCHDQMVQGFKEKLRLLILMPTGTGKTKTMVSFIDEYKKYYNFVIIVRQRDLVFQFEETLIEFNLDYGVFMHEHPKYSPKKQIQLCSIDTIGAREIYPLMNDPRDLILLIDEADETTSDKYDVPIQKYTRRHLLARPASFRPEDVINMRGAFLAGFTATAFGKPLLHFDKAIIPLTPDEALAKGALIPFEYVTPELIDLKDVKVVKGEFNGKDIETKLNTPEMIKKSFGFWLEYGKDRQTLIFVTSQDHANAFTNYINNFYGKKLAVVITAEVSGRQQIYKDFRNGVIRFLINIRIITRGVDIPEIGTILDCASTLQENLHIQKLGRGSRPNPIYKDCIIIDVANNLNIHGPFYEYERTPNLTEKPKKRSLSEVMMYTCLKCRRSVLNHPNLTKCPYCGTPKPVDEIKLSKAQKKEFEMKSTSAEIIIQRKMINEFKKILWQRKNLFYDRYQNDIDKCREASHDALIKKYGLDRVLKIKKSILLTGKFLDRVLGNEQRNK